MPAPRSDIEELQRRATQWLWTYNHELPNMGIGGITGVVQVQFEELYCIINVE